jgi:hypothetical protein
METADLVSLNTRVLCDEEPDQVSAIYLFGQTRDNQTSVLNRGVEILRGRSIPLVICGCGEVSGYPGVDVWREELIQLGVPPEGILNVPSVEPLNTLTEAIGLVQEAKRKGWKTIQIVASPFHQLRAFMSVIQALKQEYPELKAYNRVGTTLGWNEVVVHNQGTHTNVRKNFILSELERLETYHAQGNLPTVQEALAYLDARSF